MGPNFGGTGINVSFSGLGFEHRLFRCWFVPRDTAGAAQQLEHIFAALTRAEQELFPALAAHYPDTPDWYFSKT